MDKGHAGFSLQFHCLVVGVVVGAGYQADLCAQVLGVFYLHQRGTVRHADDAFDAAAGGCQRHALGVIARRAGDDALGALFLGKLADLIVSAPDLKAAGDLQVFGLQVELAVTVQAGGLDEVGAAGNVFEHKGGVVILSKVSMTIYFLSFLYSRHAVGMDAGILV